MTDLSIVLPVFNEADSLQRTVGRLKEVVAEINTINQLQLIFVDDGSTDSTWSLIQQYCGENTHNKAVRFTRNFGKESAITAGLAHADGEAILIMDSDGQHPADLIPQLFSRWQEGDVDVVSAVKIQRQNEGWMKRITGRMYYWSFRLVTGMDLSNATDFKLISKVVAKSYLALPERNKFFRGLIRWTGYQEAQVNFQPLDRDGGKSGWGFIALFRYAESTLISFATLPLRLVTVIGMATLVIAMVLTVQTLWNKFFGDALPGFTTIIIINLYIGSVLMISLGIIGSYLGKLVEEVKYRPAYIERESLQLTKENLVSQAGRDTPVNEPDRV